MAYFPMFVDMTERDCLIVGGGNVAYRKVIVMLDFGAKVTVVAEDICDELRKLTIDDIASEDKTGSYTANEENNQTDPDAAYRITFIKRRFERKDCDGMEMVIAATDDNALNHEIAEYCKAKDIMVNMTRKPRESVYLRKYCVRLLIMEGFRKYSLKYGITDFKLLFIYKL